MYPLHRHRPYYEAYGTSKYSRAVPELVQFGAELGTALGGALAFGAKGVYDIFRDYPKNKILSTNTMPYKRTFKRSRRTALSSRRSYKKKSYSKKTRKPKRTSRRTKTSLKKEVRHIKQQLNADSARHIYKQLTADAWSVSANECTQGTIAIITGSLLETYISHLRYYDPSNPGTLTTASGATGTFQREIHFKNVNAKLEVHNNYQVPCRVKIYLVKPKGDTNISPTTYYNNSIADQVITGGNTSTAGIYPTDLKTFMSQWSVKCVKDAILDAGAFTVVSHNSGAFKYDPSLFDDHSLEYQNKFKACAWFMRIEGVLGHDTSANQVTTIPTRIDYTTTLRAEIIYDAGVVLDDIYLANNRSSSFTNGGVITNKPIADNQSYSVA